MTVAVASNGRLVYSRGFGTADQDNAVPADADTLIRTGSIAKSITSAAAMTLVEAGKLDLDAGANWTETILHRFPTYAEDGSEPWSGLLASPEGALFGATIGGGAGGSGTVYRVIP